MLATEVIQLSGILDSTRAQELRDRIDQGIEQGAKIILVDFKDVTFMDSSGLGALVTALKTVRSEGGKLCVCSVNDQVRILFELTSMDRVFEIFRDQSDFYKVNGVVAGSANLN
jgi:anti-sigma B factor antagonist